MYKLGRLPRAYDPKIPHYSALLAGRELAPPPPSIDYSKGMPTSLGMMLNDVEGDCTCAKAGHLVQVWSFNAQKQMLTPTDQQIQAIYEGACGFDPNAGPPGDNPTDQGGNMQVVANYLETNGLPLPDGSTTPLLLWVEIDFRNQQDVMRIIDECGACDIGFNVPQYLIPTDGSPPPKVWDLQPDQDNTIIGGHDVILVGYDDQYLTLASWGAWYQMSWQFLPQFTEEAYGYAGQMWVEATGKTPAGLTLAQMETLMTATKN